MRGNSDWVVWLCPDVIGGKWCHLLRVQCEWFLQGQIILCVNWLAVSGDLGTFYCDWRISGWIGPWLIFACMFIGSLFVEGWVMFLWRVFGCFIVQGCWSHSLLSRIELVFTLSFLPGDDHDSLIRSRLVLVLFFLHIVSYWITDSFFIWYVFCRDVYHFRLKKY